MSSPKSWCDSLRENIFAEAGLHSVEFVKTCMLFDALRAQAETNAKTELIKEYSHDGILKGDFRQFVARLVELLNCQVTLATSEFTNDPEVDDDGYRSNNYSTVFISNATTVCLIVLTLETHHVRVNFTSVADDVDLIKRAHEYVNPLLKPEVSDGRIYVFSASSQEPLMSMGVASIPFEPGNYSESVVTDYERAIVDLNSISPAGRLVIIGGPPGTGKTFMIRALLNDVPNAMFIMLPADMVSQVMNPAMMTTLIRKKKSAKMSIIFVVEDADAVLIKRAGDNLNSISALLNMSSGIVGNMLDIRVVATTNAQRINFDEAITRSGRLSVQIDVGDISCERAMFILERLMGGPEALDKSVKLHEEAYKSFMNSKKIILADVYDFARSIGWSDVKAEAGKVRKRNKRRYSLDDIGF